MPKVLMINCDPPCESSGGAERFAWSLARELAPSCEVKVLSSAQGLRRRTSRLGRKLLYDHWGRFNAKVLEAAISDFDPDVVHFHNVYGIGSDLIARSVRDRPTVVTVHDYWPFCFTSTMTRNGRACEGRCSTCYFPGAAISASIRRRHLHGAKLVAPSEHLARVLSLAGFEAVHVDNAVDRCPRYGTSTHRLVFIGRLVREKGAELAIKAALRLGMPINVVGGGPELESLKRRYPGNGVRFHGFVDDLEAVYSKGGVVVVPSLWPENQPLVPMEAISRGMQVVAARIGGIPEIVKEGETGRLFSPGDLDSLCETVGRTLSTPVEVDVEGFRERFCWRRTVEGYHEVYRDAL
jgi:glycosyltransferase involved in cell wall biosynthesis